MYIVANASACVSSSAITFTLEQWFLICGPRNAGCPRRFIFSLVARNIDSELRLKPSSLWPRAQNKNVDSKIIFLGARLPQ